MRTGWPAVIEKCARPSCKRVSYAKALCREHYNSHRNATVRGLRERVELLEERCAALERRERQYARAGRLAVLLCRHIGLLPSELAR